MITIVQQETITSEGTHVSPNYPIEKDVPIPPVSGRGARMSPKNALKQDALMNMGISESISFTGDDELKGFIAIRVLLQRKTDKKFSIRKIVEKEHCETVYRVWRTQ